MRPAEMSAISTLALPRENPKTSTQDSTVGPPGRTNGGSRLVSTKELSKMWDNPESTLHYWCCAGIGPIYVKLGGRIEQLPRSNCTRNVSGNALSTNGGNPNKTRNGI
jgi:hypothetical protein